MKIISADHSGTVVNFEALVTRDEAERMARDLKESFEVAQGEWGSPPELKCASGENPGDFLAGGKELECTYEGERTNFYRIEKSIFGNLYYVEASYESEDQPSNFSPEDANLYFGKDSARDDCVVELKGERLDFNDLAGYFHPF